MEKGLRHRHHRIVIIVQVINKSNMDFKTLIGKRITETTKISNVLENNDIPFAYRRSFMNVLNNISDLENKDENVIRNLEYYKSLFFHVDSMIRTCRMMFDFAYEVAVFFKLEESNAILNGLKTMPLDIHFELFFDFSRKNVIKIDPSNPLYIAIKLVGCFIQNIIHAQKHNINMIKERKQAELNELRKMLNAYNRVVDIESFRLNHFEKMDEKDESDKDDGLDKEMMGMNENDTEQEKVNEQVNEHEKVTVEVDVHREDVNEDVNEEINEEINEEVNENKIETEIETEKDDDSGHVEETPTSTPPCTPIPPLQQIDDDLLNIDKLIFGSNEKKEVDFTFNDIKNLGFGLQMQTRQIINYFDTNKKVAVNDNENENYNNDGNDNDDDDDDICIVDKSIIVQ